MRKVSGGSGLSRGVRGQEKSPWRRPLAGGCARPTPWGWRETPVVARLWTGGWTAARRDRLEDSVSPVVPVGLPGVGAGTNCEDRKNDEDQAEEGDNVHQTRPPFGVEELL